jgi:hypothetical protein
MRQDRDAGSVNKQDRPVEQPKRMVLIRFDQLPHQINMLVA